MFHMCLLGIIVVVGLSCCSANVPVGEAPEVNITPTEETGNDSPLKEKELPWWVNRDLVEAQRFMVEKSMTEWTRDEWIKFPCFTIIPTEILAWMSSAVKYFCSAGDAEHDLPHGEMTGKPLSNKSRFYIWFNRTFMVAMLTLWIMNVVWASSAVEWDMDKLNLVNGLGSFFVCFSLSDFTYYVGHRFVHRYRTIYAWVHKHHHGEPEPVRGWADTCNATPADFFYTAVTTSPMSSLWVFPVGSVHIVAVVGCLWCNAFVGSLGHCRADLNWGIFNSRFHAGHHSNATTNFAQNVEIWDRLFGTFKFYDAEGIRARQKKGKMQ